MTSFSGSGLSDSVRGGPLDDTLLGNGGNDTLIGLEGADSVDGGAGDDFLYQNNLPGGDDGEADTLVGGGGNDFLSVGSGDAAFGGFGDDTFRVRGGAPSILSGGTGEDRLLVTALDLSTSRIGGIERLEVGSEDSVGMGVAQFGSFAVIAGASGVERLNLAFSAGGRGTLTFDGALSSVFVTGSDANEIVTFVAASGVGISYAGGDGDTSLASGDGNDSLYGGTGADTLDGGGGNDLVVGSEDTETEDSGADVLLGGRGDDTIVALTGDVGDGGDGNDIVALFAPGAAYGDAGNDILLGSTGDDTLDGGAGADTVWLTSESDPVVVDLSLTTPQLVGNGTDLILRIENAVGTGLDDSLTGTDGANVLEGAEGNDTLDGGAGRDTAAYTQANASVTVDLRIVSPQDTGAGVDTFVSIENLSGGAGDDSLYGDARANVLSGFSVGPGMLMTDGGNDLLDGRAGRDLADYSLAVARVSVDLSETGPQATGGAGTDTLVRIEDLRGSLFDDGLAGNAAPNQLSGLAGDDILVGGANNDTLIGGLGTDRMRGGTGFDTFDFNATAESTRAAPDVVLDFIGAGASWGDVIDLSSIDANTTVAGNQAFAFGGRGAGGLTLVDFGTDTLVRGNTDADAAFEFAILLRDGGRHASVYSDFDFVL